MQGSSQPGGWSKLWRCRIAGCTQATPVMATHPALAQQATRSSLDNQASCGSSTSSLWLDLTSLWLSVSLRLRHRCVQPCAGGSSATTQLSGCLARAPSQTNLQLQPLQTPIEPPTTIRHSSVITSSFYKHRTLTHHRAHHGKVSNSPSIAASAGSLTAQLPFSGVCIYLNWE